MQLSDRLKKVSSLVALGSRVADIGCDHAYLSIYLVEKGVSPYVIAMDINQGPVERARKNIEDYGYKSKIEVRKSDGLKELKSGEVDCLLMAGMGGSLMLDILSESKDYVVKEIDSIILQPQSEIELVRRKLKDFGFLITQEDMVKEHGKYYVMMRGQRQSIIKNKKTYELTKDEHYRFGRILLEKKHNILYEFLLKEKDKLKLIHKKLKESPTKSALIRQEEILSTIRLVDDSLEYFHEGEKRL